MAGVVWGDQADGIDLGLLDTGLRALERAGFEVMLVPPRMTKQIGGRKSDVLDCQWIWQLMSYGLLRGAFVRATRFARCAPTHAR